MQYMHEHDEICVNMVKSKNKPRFNNPTSHLLKLSIKWDAAYDQMPDYMFGAFKYFTGPIVIMLQGMNFYLFTDYRMHTSDSFAMTALGTFFEFPEVYKMLFWWSSLKYRTKTVNRNEK